VIFPLALTALPLVLVLVLVLAVGLEAALPLLVVPPLTLPLPLLPQAAMTVVATTAAATPPSLFDALTRLLIFTHALPLPHSYPRMSRRGLGAWCAARLRYQNLIGAARPLRWHGDIDNRCSAFAGKTAIFTTSLGS
jgi:hypothetical protein